MGHSIRGIKHWLKTHLTPSGGKASNLVQPRSAPNGLHARDASKQTLAPRQPVPFSQRKPVPERVPQQTQAPAGARGQATVQMIEERAPFSARNLGRMIANAKLQMAEMDPASRARCEANLIRTFEEMDRAVQDHRGSGLPSFVERVLMVADENVGVNDLALVGDLVAASTRMVHHLSLIHI